MATVTLRKDFTAIKCVKGKKILQLMELPVHTDSESGKGEGS